MNSSYNYSDFIGLALESNDDYEPYGYDMERLQTVETTPAYANERSIESIIFASRINQDLRD